MVGSSQDDITVPRGAAVPLQFFLLFAPAISLELWSKPVEDFFAAGYSQSRARRLYLDSIFVLPLLRTYIRQVEQSFGEQALLKELQGSPLIVHPFGSKKSV